MAERMHRPQVRARVGRLFGLGLCALALAGCSIIPAPNPQVEPLPVPQSAPTIPQPERLPLPEPIPQARPPVQAPLPQQSQVPQAERHAVAVLVPLTGPNAGVGQSIANAANLALADTGGARIRITVYDTGRGATVAANQALAAGNRLILGPLLAEEARAIAPAARRAGVPVVSFSNDVSAAGEGVNIIGFNPAQSIERVVAFARSRGVQRFGALVPAGTYGQRASTAMIAAVERAGGRMVGMQTYDRSPAGLRNAASRLANQGQYGAVLIADSPRIAAQAVPLVRRGSPGARILGTELWAAEEQLGETAALRGAWFAGVTEARFDQFRARYRQRYNAAPYRLSSLGYDAVLLAIRIAGDLPVGSNFPSLALRDREPFIGLDGAFQFGRDGVARRALEVHEVSATGTTTVSPAPPRP